MCSTYNEEKSVVAERFNRTLKNKIFKYKTAVSKNAQFDVLDGIVNKYNNTVHRSIKMKPIDVKSDSYAEYDEDSNEKDPKFKIGDHVRISKYKKLFTKGYTQHWSEEVFVVSKIKNIVPCTYVIGNLNDEKKKMLEVFMKKNCKKLVKKKSEQKKHLKEKVINSMSNGKDMIIHLIVGWIKEISQKNESILS